MLTFEIYLHRSRATHFKDQEGLSRVVMGLGSWFKETKDKEITKCSKNLVEHSNNHVTQKRAKYYLFGPKTSF